MTQVDPELYALRPWYHDFGAFGFDTTFLGVPLTFEERMQRAVEVLGARLTRIRPGRQTSAGRPGRGPPVPGSRPARALASPAQPAGQGAAPDAVRGAALSALGSRPNCLELFSADGYYSCRIRMLAPDARITGIELDPDHIRRAETIARRLAFANVRFRQERRAGVPRGIDRDVRPRAVRRGPVPRERPGPAARGRPAGRGSVPRGAERGHARDGGPRTTSCSRRRAGATGAGSPTAGSRRGSRRSAGTSSRRREPSCREPSAARPGVELLPLPGGRARELILTKCTSPSASALARQPRQSPGGRAPAPSPDAPAPLPWPRFPFRLVRPALGLGSAGRVAPHAP